MTMAMTGKTAPYKRDFGVMPGGVFHARYPVEAKGISVDDAIQSIEDIFAEDIAAHDVAAIVLEPVQGEGGFNVVPAAFLNVCVCSVTKMGFYWLQMKYSPALPVQASCLPWIIMILKQI